MPIRCAWANGGPLEIEYHDTEWGVPSRDAWSTILRKRENYRKAFAGFDPFKVARFDARKRAALMRDPGIVRNRLKIEATVANARQVLAVQDEHGSLAAYLWQFVEGVPVVNAWTAMGQVPAETAASRAMSKALLKRGFRFVGPTICYAFMQATGMVNDHITTCFRYSKRRSRRA